MNKAKPLLLPVKNIERMDERSLEQSTTIEDQTLQKSWQMELQNIGYNSELPPPIPAVQATFAVMESTAIHVFIQDSDTAALADQDEEGHHAPLLLTTLALSDWTHIFLAATKSEKDGLDKLAEAHSKLCYLLQKEEEDNDEAERFAPILSDALHRASMDKLPERPRKVPESTTIIEKQLPHPLLGLIKVPDSSMAALEDLSEYITQTQISEAQEQLISAGAGPNVPLMASQVVESMVSDEHKCWTIGNMGLLAPITIPMWTLWGSLSDADIDSYKKNVAQNTGLLREPTPLFANFTLNSFCQSKCNTAGVIVHTKRDLATGNNRFDSFANELWNVQRPYLRCQCAKNANSGCRGTMIWFDHAVNMLNNLQLFFPTKMYPSLREKMVAFWIWIRHGAKLAVRLMIQFQISRSWMVTAAKQYLEDPNAKLLTDLGNGAGIKKIKRMLKPPRFSANIVDTSTTSLQEAEV